MSDSIKSSNFPNQTRILLSIKPQFAFAILHGQKKFEFRRNIFARQVDVILIYATAPIQRVVGEFDVSSIISEPVPVLWKRTREYAGIDETLFFEYFQGCNIGHAIEIGEVRAYSAPFCPVERFGLKPPQSFTYLNL